MRQSLSKYKKRWDMEAWMQAGAWMQLGIERLDTVGNEESEMSTATCGDKAQHHSLMTPLELTLSMSLQGPLVTHRALGCRVVGLEWNGLHLGFHPSHAGTTNTSVSKGTVSVEGATARRACPCSPRARACACAVGAHALGCHCKVLNCCNKTAAS